MTDIVYDVTVINMIYLGRTSAEAIELKKRFPFAVIKPRRLKPCEPRPRPREPEGAA